MVEAIASLLVLLLPVRFSTSVLATSKLLSASGIMARLPGLYSIEIGVSGSFSSHLICFLLKFGYENMCLSGSWSVILWCAGHQCMATTIDNHAQLQVFSACAWGNCAQHHLTLGCSMLQACHPQCCCIAQASCHWQLGWHRSQL